MPLWRATLIVGALYVWLPQPASTGLQLLGFIMLFSALVLP